MKILKRVLAIILSLLAAIVLLVGVVIAIFAPANSKAMNRAVETTINTISKNYTVEEVDCGDYSKMTVYGIMKFHVNQYNVEGIGNLSTMTVNMGLMQMATVVLTPVDRDIPLVSLDYMYILGNRTCYLEFYDLVLNQDENYKAFLNTIADIRDEHNTLENVTPSSAWYDSLKTECIYKKGKKDNDDELITILEEGIDAVMAYSKSLPELNEEEHAQKVVLQKQYSDGLIENGGISTDVFVKSLGADATKDFFDKVLFKAE